MAEIQDLTATAASHARWPEGMAPSGVNDSARLDEGIILRWFLDTNHSVVATVSASVIQMTANRTSITLTGTTSNYMADLLMAFTMGSVASPDGCYINLNGIGKISLRDALGNSLSASALAAGTRALIIKDDTNNYFRLLRPLAGAISGPLTVGGTLAVTGLLTLSAGVNFGGTTLSTYAEGALTITDTSGATLAFTIGGTPYYRKIGTMVFVSSFSVQYPVTANGSNAAIGTLPFTPKDANTRIFGVLNDQGGGSVALVMNVSGATTTIAIMGLTGTTQTNANLSGRILVFPPFFYPTAT